MESEPKTVKCLFNKDKICPNECRLHAFIKYANEIGATQNDAQKPDPELQAQCKLSEN